MVRLLRRAPSLALPLLACVLLLLPKPLHAQRIQPLAAGGVEVTPDGDADPIRLANGSYSTTFNVRNTGTFTYLFTLACGVGGTVSGCTLDLGEVSVGAGATVGVAVLYTTGATGGAGTVTLTASRTGASDQGSRTVTTIVPVTPTGPVIARELCLTIAAGPGAAYECGDLRLEHPLPGIRTVNKLRTPVLLYHGQHAYPFPGLSADLTLAANDRPDSVIVTARLEVSGSFVQRDRRAWPGTQWGTSGQAATRRVMTSFAASDLTTGLYRFQLELGRKVAGGSYTVLRTDTGTVALINRATSPFGAGWWLAGFEQLRFLADGSILWLDGDGSVRRYVNTGTWNSRTWYVARPTDAPDTLVAWSGSYYRYGKGGVEVKFNGNGFHVQTKNRLGQVTTFAPDANGRLATITVPGAGAGRTYTFTYAGPNGTLSAVTSPDSSAGPGRVTTLYGATAGSGARVDSIRDPGHAVSVRFLYANGTHPAAITGRTDRRQATTSFTLGTGLRLVGTSLPVPAAATITQAFCPADIRVWACGSGLTPPESTYTIYDGPRTDSADVIHVWADSLGAVTQVRDPYGYRTIIAHGDARWPALPTRVQDPSGLVRGATYDARGNLATATDSNAYTPGQHPTSAWFWDPRWDQVTMERLPNGQTASFGIDSANGNRLWAEDARGQVSRTTFQYHANGTAAGLLSTVIPPLGARTTLTYDARGNLATVQEGPFTTYYQNDSLGRVKLTRSPLGLGQFRHDTTTYDLADRPVRTTTYTPALYTAPSARITTYQTFDEESNLTQLQQIQSPDTTGLGWLTTQWVFDAANRRVVEIARDGARDSTEFDAAGNVVRARNRNGNMVTMAYDRVNRLRTRTVPDTSYAGRYSPGSLGSVFLTYMGSSRPRLYPWYPNQDSSLRISGDTATFAYDSAGRLVRADNGSARIRRRYYPNGQLRLDSLWIRNYADTTFGHVYGMAYTYDLNGRIVALRHPAALAAGMARDSVRYVYDDTTGALTAVHTLLGNQVGFLNDLRGALVRKTYPGGITDSMTYDSLGFLTLERLANGSQSPYKYAEAFLRAVTFRYDGPPGQVTEARNAYGWRDTTTATYSPLGALLAYGFTRPRHVTDSALYVGSRHTTSRASSYDPLGNRHAGMSGDSDSLWWGDRVSGGSTEKAWFHNAVGRIDSIGDGGGRHGFLYDPAGNTTFFYQSAGPGTLNDRASWYGADNRLRAAEFRSATPNGYGTYYWDVTFEEYRYDALGRRVLVMSRRDCLPQGSDTTYKDCGVSRLRRTVWSGAQELWEIQRQARPGDSLAMERDTAWTPYPAGYKSPTAYSDPNVLFGLVAYTYGGTIDQPVAITRRGLVRIKVPGDTTRFASVELFPHWNWRGQADIGTFADGGEKVCANATHCVYPQWREVAYTPGLAGELLWVPLAGASPYGWFGSLIAAKEDGTGTYYRRNRVVDPMTGRFTQEDPIGFAGGVNLYAFAGNNPVAFTDPFGLCTKADNWKDCREATRDEGVKILEAGFAEMADYKKHGITYGKPPTPGQTQDCSHFYCASANRAGLHIDYRNTTVMAKEDGFKLIGASEARAGDVIMRPGHVGIYTGQQDRQGRFLALDMGGRSPDYTRLLSNWGPGSSYGNLGPITFYRPMVPTTPTGGN